MHKGQVGKSCRSIIVQGIYPISGLKKGGGSEEGGWGWGGGLILNQRLLQV